MSTLLRKTIGNRYHVQEFLGRGAMADVYKVWDSQRMVNLAAKVLHHELALDRVFLRRFKREADTLSKLQHPNIVRSYGLEQEGPLAFMLLDYIEGTTLKQVIFDAGGPMSTAEVLKVLSPTARALQYAHNNGLVHCDIKPSNIMIHKNGNVFITDFGIARMSDAATATMVGAGTPAYMAPEQIMEKDPVPGTDIYSLGIVIYEMITGGERPFTSEHAEVTGTVNEKLRWEQLHLDPPSPRTFNPGVNESLEKIVMRCLEKDPGDRYQSSLEVLNALGAEETRMRETLDEEANQELVLTPNPVKNFFIQLNQKVFSRFPVWVWVTAFVLIGTLLTFTIARGLGASSAAGLFASKSGERSTEVAVVGATSTPAYTNTPRYTSTPAATSTPAFTPTPQRATEGQIIFQSDEDGDREIYLYDLASGQTTQLTNNNADDFQASWSPDGDQIVWISEESGRPEIWIMDANGSNKEQLTRNKLYKRFPSWGYHEDGREIIAYIIIAVQKKANGEWEEVPLSSVSSYYPSWAADEYKVCQLEYIAIDAPGDRLRLLTENIICMNGIQSDVKFSYSGNRWAYTNWDLMDPEGRYDKSLDIWERYPENGWKEPVSDLLGKETDISWHPNEDWNGFTYAADVTDSNGWDWEIYTTVDLRGRDHTRMTDNTAHDRDPCYSPDGNFLVFSSDRDGEDFDLYIIRADSPESSRNPAIPITDNRIFDETYPEWRP